ncbi:TonB-dependent receptor [Altererythrobacter sp. KTW20L]|uniref:TonB-dependent receptor n=1 Tax=Altererythrobacter sp. KTW20L TaxID=2942210 RepID=UPI0020BF401C|nr:TonB-dependent receptor [Altererythrobacter sp. KTW20L]MCL6249717.1 TonB-dependent receptor [Altererythrobacter sp. KTW20L]
MTIRTAGTARSLLSGVAALALATPFAAQAQNAPEEVIEPAAGNMIIVTATKRETTLQETPVAVSVTTAETLQREQIRDLKDLQTIVPSLRVSQLQSSANTNFIIRGFGNGANNAGIEPSVGVFVDGVYRSRTAAQISDLPNVSRIEVLRGPQSTLFGKNASAGVISLVTDAPSFTPEGSIEASYGNFDAMVLRGYVSGPISDDFAVSIAGGINKRDGYLTDPASGTETNERDRWFVRGQALYDNGDNVSVRIIADYDRIDENCCGVVNVQRSAASAAILGLGGQLNDPNDPFADLVYNNFASTNDIENYGLSAQLDFELGSGLTLTSISAWRNTSGAYDQDVDFTSLDLLQRYQTQKLETYTQELRLSGSAGPVTFLAGLFYFDESITENQNIFKGDRFRNFADLSAGGNGTGSTIQVIEATIGQLYGLGNQYIGQFGSAGLAESGQFLLSNDALSLFGQVDFEITNGLVLTIGGNYTMDDKRVVTDYQSIDVFSNIDLVDAGNRAIFAQGVATTVGNALMLGRPATQAEIQAFATGTSPAGLAGAQAFPTIQAGAQAFANANQNDPNVNPFLVGRALQLFPRFINIPNGVEDGRTSDNDLAYTVRLAYDVNPDLNVYASYATGFKASSFNLGRDSRPLAADLPALRAANPTFNNQMAGSRFAGPENSKVIELGVKGNWDMFSMNLTGFRQDINGFQSNIFTGTGFLLSNAGKQRTWGVELESQANPIDPLTLNFAVTWLDPTYVSFPLSSVGDLSGTRPSGIPEWTIVLGAQWEQDLGNGDLLVLRSTFHHESNVQVIEGLPGFLAGGQAAAIAAAAPFQRQVDDLSASLTYEFTDLDLAVSVWGRNLLNDRYLLSLFDSPGQPGSISGYPNQPRTYGVTVRKNF